MPSFRDLKGKPVEEVTSQLHGNKPAEPTVVPSVETDEAAVLRAAAKVVADRKARGERFEPVTESPIKHNGVNPSPVTAKPEFSPPGQEVPLVVLPDDFETGLQNLEGSLVQISKSAARLGEGVELAQHQIKLLRARAQQDQSRLARLEVIEKALK